MGTFQRWNNAFCTGQDHEGIQALLVIGSNILHPLDIFQVAVLGAYTRIIQSGSDGINR